MMDAVGETNALKSTFKRLDSKMKVVHIRIQKGMERLCKCPSTKFNVSTLIGPGWYLFQVVVKHLSYIPERI